MQTRSFSRRSLIGGIAALLAVLSLCSVASAQSLNWKTAAPMQPGENAGTVDNFVGNNFFYFYGGPGQVTVKASFKSMGLMGNGWRAPLTVFLTGMDNGHRVWDHHMVLTSVQNAVQQPLTVNVKKAVKIILSVCPPTGGLIRTGGDYTVSVTGAGVRFDKPLSDADMVVGTYTGNDGSEDGAVKFLANGTLEFASGTTGTWKLFDADSHLFTVIFADKRLSLKLMPGRGLLDARDPSTIVFQRTK